MLKNIGAALLLVLSCGAACAQTSTSIEATPATSRAPLTASTATYKWVKLSTPSGAPKTYYALGTDGVEVTAQGPYLPINGGDVCFGIYVGFPAITAWYIAAMTDTGSTVVSIEQQASCP